MSRLAKKNTSKMVHADVAPEPALEKVIEADVHPHIAYQIMTKDGWRPLPVKVVVEREIMKNPFMCWQKAGAKSFADWLRRAG